MRRCILIKVAQAYGKVHKIWHLYIHLLCKTTLATYSSAAGISVPKTGDDHDQTPGPQVLGKNRSYNKPFEEFLGIDKKPSTGCGTWIFIGVDDDSTAKVFTWSSSSSDKRPKCHKRHAPRQLESQAHHKGKDEGNDQQRLWCLRRAHQWSHWDSNTGPTCRLSTYICVCVCWKNDCTYSNLDILYAHIQYTVYVL